MKVTLGFILHLFQVIELALAYSVMCTSNYKVYSAFGLFIRKDFPTLCPQASTPQWQFKQSNYKVNFLKSLLFHCIELHN
jgi:hypothetical protein